MALPPPEWATEGDLQEHGCAFLNLFRDREHFDHFRATGLLSLPKSARDTARRRADPVKQRRENLRSMVYRARRAVERTQQRIADAQAAIADPSNYWRWSDEETLKREQQRLPDYIAAHARAERDFELFTLIHEAPERAQK